MDAVARAEDVRRHLRVPAPRVMAEMNARFEQLAQRVGGKHENSFSGWTAAGEIGVRSTRNRRHRSGPPAHARQPQPCVRLSNSNYLRRPWPFDKDRSTTRRLAKGAETTGDTSVSAAAKRLLLRAAEAPSKEATIALPGRRVHPTRGSSIFAVMFGSDQNRSVGTATRARPGSCVLNCTRSRVSGQRALCEPAPRRLGSVLVDGARQR